MTSARFLFSAAPMLLLVVAAHLTLLQHAARVQAGSLNHLDYVAKKGETRADKRGAKLPTVKKELDPDEEVAAVELEPLDDENGDEDEQKTTLRPTQKSRSSFVGAWWSTVRPRPRGASSKAKVEKDMDEDLDLDEDKMVDPLGHEGKLKGKEGRSRSDFEIEENEDGQSPIIVLKIHPVDRKRNSGPGGPKPTLSPSMDRLVQDNQGKTGPNGTVIITIRPDLSLIAKLNKTGEIDSFATTTINKNATSSSYENSNNSSSSASSSIKITQDGILVKTDAGTTTQIPTFKLSTTQKPGQPTKSTTKPTTAKPTTGRPASGKPTSARPTNGKASTSRPIIGVSTSRKPTTAKPTSGKPAISKPTNGKPTTGKPTSKTTRKPTPKPRSTKKPSTKPGASKSTTKGPSSKTSKKPLTSRKPTKAPSGRCTARPDCQCNYQELKDTDKMLAVVITNRGGFKGRRLNSNAIAQIMASKLSFQEMLNVKAKKPITVNSNNTYVLPAGHYYFPSPIRFAGFVSP